MIEINGKQYFSKYIPADKEFFYNFERAFLILKKCNNSDIYDKMKAWEIHWDLSQKESEARDILEDHKFNFLLRKQLKEIIKDCEYRRSILK